MTARIEKDSLGKDKYINGAVENVTIRVQRSQEREALISFAAILRTEPTRKDLVSTVLTYLTIYFQLESIILIRYESVSDQLVIEGARGYWDYLTNKAIPLNKQLTTQIITTGQPLVIGWIDYDPIFQSSITLGESQLVAGIPITTEGRTMGVIWVGKQAAIQKEQMELFVAMGDMLANALERTILQEKTQQRVQRLSALRFDSLQRSNMELHLSYDTTLESWVKALDIRLGEGPDNSQILVDMTIKMARILRVPDNEIIHLRRGALLHDIGNMLLPDSILLKPSSLEDEERQLIHRHPLLARELLSAISSLRPAMVIPVSHHERWDGSGYPDGLKGSEIPLAGRIFAMVDVWNALRSDRPHRKAWTEEETINYLRQQAGILFDPEITRRFLEMVLVS